MLELMAELTVQAWESLLKVVPFPQTMHFMEEISYIVLLKQPIQLFASSKKGVA